jgi:hypothetical protein
MRRRWRVCLRFWSADDCSPDRRADLDRYRPHRYEERHAGFGVACARGPWSGSIRWRRVRVPSNLHCERQSYPLQLSNLGCIDVGSTKDGDARRPGYDLLKNLQVLAAQLGKIEKQPSNVASRPCDARHQPGLNGIDFEIYPHDWDGTGRVRMFSAVQPNNGHWSKGIKPRLFRLTRGLLESRPIFHGDGRSLLPKNVRVCRRADCP